MLLPITSDNAAKPMCYEQIYFRKLTPFTLRFAEVTIYK